MESDFVKLVVNTFFSGEPVKTRASDKDLDAITPDIQIPIAVNESTDTRIEENGAEIVFDED